MYGRKISPPQAMAIIVFVAIAVFYGGAAKGIAADFPPTIRLSTIQATEGVVAATTEAVFLGSSVSLVGDINGDGVDDFAVGAPASSPNSRTRAGTVYILFGKQATSGALPSPVDFATLNGTNGFRIDGVEIGGELGTSVANAGDLNGDGLQDLALGAPWASPFGRANAGLTYVLFGRQGQFGVSFDLGTLDGTNGVRIVGGRPNQISGLSVKSTGDFNGDGVADLAVGAPSTASNAQPPAGSAYLIFGKSVSDGSFSSTIDLAALAPSTGLEFTVGQAGDRLGISVSGSGDINQDGLRDIVVGASGSDVNMQTSVGRAYIVFGQHTFANSLININQLSGVDGFEVVGRSGGDGLGISVSEAGDFNGDGVDDVIVGAWVVTTAAGQVGETYVIYGKRAVFPASIGVTTIDGTNGIKLLGSLGIVRSGNSVSAAGDVNGDGVDDVIVGAW